MQCLKRGLVVSCNCWKDEGIGNRSRTHGLSKTAEYHVWSGIMKKRCFDPASNAYSNYGGRGIRVCDEWLDDFPAFLAHVGKRPSVRHSIDRIDNNGNYEPGNVRWATKLQQANNCRDNHLLTVNGQTHTLAQWARMADISPTSLLHRLARGWDLEQAIKTSALTDTTRRNNLDLTFEGQTLCLAEWARKTGIGPVTIRQRLKLGWPVEKALTKPVQ